VVEAQLRALLITGGGVIKERETQVVRPVDGRARVVEASLEGERGGEGLGRGDNSGQRERGEASNTVHVDPPMKESLLGGSLAARELRAAAGLVGGRRGGLVHIGRGGLEDRGGLGLPEELGLEVAALGGGVLVDFNGRAVSLDPGV